MTDITEVRRVAKLDSLLKVNTDFPGAQSGVPKGNLFRNIRELPESVKEE